MGRPLRQGVRPVLAGAGWLVAAGVATTVGLLAVGAVGASVVGTSASALSPEEVERALARSTTAAPVQPTAAASVSVGGASRVLVTPGGTIIARCLDRDATLVSWSPAIGFDAEDVSAGPSPTASLVFEAEGVELRVRVVCATGVPTATTINHADVDNDDD